MITGLYDVEIGLVEAKQKRPIVNLPFSVDAFEGFMTPLLDIQSL